MYTQQDAGLVEKLRRKFPSDVVTQLAMDNDVEIAEPDITLYLLKCELTPAMIKGCDPDVMNFWLIHRSAEIDHILDAPKKAAEKTAADTRDELSIFYTNFRNGRVTNREMIAWIETNFGADWERFYTEFPQLGTGSYLNDNTFLIVGDIASRAVYPNYAELVTSFQRLALAQIPKFQLFVKPNEFYTGRQLAAHIRQNPIELLEPRKPQPTRQQTQSADEFRAEHMELQETRLPDALLHRAQQNFARFLKTDVGRAWQKINDEGGMIALATQRLQDYLRKKDLGWDEQGYEIAALATCNEISMTLGPDHADGLYAKGGGTTLHSEGGGRENQLPLGSSGMAGQKVESPYPRKVWTAQEVRDELKKLNANQYQERMRDRDFMDAIERFNIRP